MAASATNLREKIAFHVGAPVTVSFEYKDLTGKEQTGKFGVEWRHFLLDNQIMWVPGELQNLIEQHNGTTDTLTITKLTAENSRTKTPATWRVEPHLDEPLEATLARSIANAKNTTDARARAELAPAPAAAPRSFPLKPGRQHEATADEIREANENAHRITQRAADIAAALCAAIDGARAAEQYAQSLGLKLQFSASDIRAMANTSQIGEQR